MRMCRSWTRTRTWVRAWVRRIPKGDLSAGVDAVAAESFLGVVGLGTGVVGGGWRGASWQRPVGAAVVVLVEKASMSV
jgi:hypothetical protein